MSIMLKAVEWRYQAVRENVTWEGGRENITSGQLLVEKEKGGGGERRVKEVGKGRQTTIA